MQPKHRELSQKNKYWLSQNRLFQVQYFCYQYDEWKNQINGLSILKSPTIDSLPITGGKSDPTQRIALEISELQRKIDLVENTVREVDKDLYNYLLIGFTHREVSYEYLNTFLGMPCGRRQYYQKYRRFYWMISKKMRD